MRESLKNQIEKYALARKKRRIRRQVACLLSVCIAVTVFGALMQPAVSREKRDPLLEAETLHAQPGSPLAVKVSATGESEGEKTVFVLREKSLDAGLSADYVFTPDPEDGSRQKTQIDTDGGGSLTLYRSVAEDGMRYYSFSLKDEDSVCFTLRCLSGAEETVRAQEPEQKPVESESPSPSAETATDKDKEKKSASPNAAVPAFAPAETAQNTTSPSPEAPSAESPKAEVPVVSENTETKPGAESAVSAADEKAAAQNKETTAATPSDTTPTEKQTEAQQAKLSGKSVRLLGETQSTPMLVMTGAAASSFEAAKAALDDAASASTLTLSWDNAGNDSANETKTGDSKEEQFETETAEGTAPQLRHEADGGISGYTIYADDTVADGSHYYVIESDGQKYPVYCYNFNYAPPLGGDGTTGFIRYDYFADNVPLMNNYSGNTPDAGCEKTKQQVAALLFAGYPCDGTGLQSSTGKSDVDAQGDTQYDVWHFCDEKVPYSSITSEAARKAFAYKIGISVYGATTTDTFGHTGDVTISGGGGFTKRSDGSCKSATYTVGGSYDGSFFFSSLPSGVTVCSAADGSTLSSLKSGDSFYFKAADKPTDTLNFNYSYVDSNVYYYAASVKVDSSYPDPSGHYKAGDNYQNFVRMSYTRVPGTLTVTPGSNAPVTDLTVKKTWADGKSGHSAVTMRLFADDEDLSKSCVLSNDNNWSYTFSELPYFRADGVTPVVYTVREDSVEGYTAASQRTDTPPDTSAGTAGSIVITVTNTASTFDLPETGGPGCALYLFAGAFLTAGAGIPLLKRKLTKHEPDRGRS